MRVKVLVEDFKEGLSKLSGLKPSRFNTVLNNVLIQTQEKGIKLTTSNLDLTLVTNVQCEILEKGEFTLPLQKLLSIVSTFRGDIELSTDDKTGKISNLKTQVEIEGISASLFPNIEFIEANMFKIETSVFKKALATLKDFTLSLDTKQVYSGINIILTGNNLEINATDGNRLAQFKSIVENGFDFNITIPQDVVKDIQKIQSEFIEISTDNKFLFIKSDDLLLQSVLLEGRFPNISSILPKENQFKLIFDKAELAESINRCNPILETQKQAVNSINFELKATAGVLRYKSSNGLLEENIICQNNAGDIKLAFKPSYLQAIVKNIQSEQLEMSFNSVKSAFVVNNNEFLFLVMPLVGKS